MKKPQPVLMVSNLRIQRGGTEILQDVSWDVNSGEHWVILGANGSGKTSLLSAITGYLTPTAGEISVLGQRYGHSDWRELRKHVGLVSSSVRQMIADAEPALNTVLSGKYAMVNLWGRTLPRDRAEARRMLMRIEATHLAERSWGVLSQGERQRLLIGRALMGRPGILILDEPCAGLDPAAREHFLHFLQRLGSRRGGPTLVLVTHHVEEIMPAFTHVLMLKAGRVLAAGRKAGLLSGPLLTSAFGPNLVLRKVRNRYSLIVQAKLDATFNRKVN